MLIEFTNENKYIEILEKEQTFLENTIYSEIKNREIILLYINMFSEKNDNDSILELNKHINILNNNITRLENLKSIIIEIKNSNSSIDFENQLNEYNNQFIGTFNDIFISNYDRNIFLNILIKKFVTSSTNNETNNEFNNLKDNNVLLISEKEQEVFLPYKKKHIENILLLSDKYYTPKEVIDNLFVIPIQKYTNSATARFREAFNLMHRREFASFFKSLDFALEMFSKYDLHPAIISACQTLDELDIYLDCLDNNELNKFDIFEIKYEIAPSIVKQKDKF